MEPIVIDGRVGQAEYLDDSLAKVLFDDGTIAFFRVRVAGGAGSGNFAHSGRKGEVGGSSKDDAGGDPKYRPDGTLRDERSLRALAAHVPGNARTQKWGLKGEELIVGKTDGEHIGGKEPVDVITKFGGRTQGVEVKSLINQKNDKITMRKDALERKAAWTEKNGAPVHTVVVDWRDRSSKNPGTYSGHRVYFHAGVGSFQLSSFTKVQSDAHLGKLLGKRYK